MCLCMYTHRASPAAQPQRISLQCRRCGFDPWVGKIPWRRQRLPTPVFSFSEEFEYISCGSNTFPSVSAGKESACRVGDPGLISGLRRSPGEGKGHPLWYSVLENSMDCIAHGVAKSRTRLSDFHFHFQWACAGWAMPFGQKSTEKSHTKDICGRQPSPKNHRVSPSSFLQVETVTRF